MAARRKPKIVQVIPTAPEGMFEVVELTPGENYFRIRIKDAIVGDEPIFRYDPPKKGSPFSMEEIAYAGSKELNEGSGTVTVTEFKDGIPVRAAVFTSINCCVRQVWTTEQAA